MSNERFQNALSRTPQKTPPVWMMRQAGRYHKHYQALRQKYSFMELCKQPDVAAQVALGPIQDFDFDLAILFSDLLFPLEALGMGLEYTDKGPRLGFSLNRETFSRLRPWAEALPHLQFQKEAVRATREVLPKNKSLIGFIGGPWTLFVYAVEGSHQGNLLQSKKDGAFWAAAAERLMPLLKANIELQLAGGAEVVMILDTAAGELSPAQFQSWTEKPLLDLVNAFPGRVGYYSKGTQMAHFSPAFVSAPWAGFGFDHRWDLKQILPTWKRGFVQGNLDQSLLHQEAGDFDRTLQTFFAPMRDLTPEQRAGWVAGLGHGILPQTPERNVRAFVDTLRETFA